MIKVKELKKAELEIVYFECKDIITTSVEHDNGYTGSDQLSYIVDDLKKIVPDSFLK